MCRELRRTKGVETMWIAKRRHRAAFEVDAPQGVPGWIGRTYTTAGKAVVVVVGILIGFEVGWALLMFIQYPQIQADQKQQRLEELVSENNQVCTGWGFEQGTYAYDRCTLDLDQVRQNERGRLQRDQDFF